MELTQFMFFAGRNTYHKESFIHDYPPDIHSLQNIPRTNNKFLRLYDAIEFGRRVYSSGTAPTSPEDPRDQRTRFLELVLDLEPKLKEYQELIEQGKIELTRQRKRYKYKARKCRQRTESTTEQLRRLAIQARHSQNIIS